VALHVRQPLTPSGGDDLRTAALIGNLQYMAEHPAIGGNHNAPEFRHCYARMADIVPALLAGGGEPRVMLEYSGTLLRGLRLRDRAGAGRRGRSVAQNQVKGSESPQEPTRAQGEEESAAQGRRRAATGPPSLRLTLSIYTLCIE